MPEISCLFPLKFLKVFVRFLIVRTFVMAPTVTSDVQDALRVENPYTMAIKTVGDIFQDYDYGEKLRSSRD